jgi:hypothetical protein
LADGHKTTLADDQAPNLVLLARNCIGQVPTAHMLC